MQKKHYGALSAMCSQAGGTRVVVSFNEKGSDWAKSTHYKDMDKFWDRILTEKIDLNWYQVKGGDRVFVAICPVCNQFYDKGDLCNCQVLKETK